MLAAVVLVAAVLFVLLLANDTAAGPPSGSIPAGYDLFETDPAQTVFRFEGQTAIPPNFFAPGSQQFQGDVPFGGQPIGTFHAKNTGDADTIVQRKNAASVPAVPSSSNPIPIELVNLSLVGMAPIAVQVGSGTQLWDVRADASPSRPSTGFMVINRTSTQGGVFDSQLQVYPKFTFTRLSDGATKVLDVGALPDGQRPDDPLVATQTPWRFGCVPPALATGLDPSFCPGQTPQGKKTLTIEQSQFARHGVWPAQPALEHFVCYSVPKNKRPPLGVKLSDQFGRRDASVLRGQGGTLCNPVRKNKEQQVRNRQDHLRCYLTKKAAPLNRQVLLRNQFGPFSAKVLAPTGLCVPSTKQEVPKGKPPKPPKHTFAIDHFQCYRIQPGGKYKQRSVVLTDQFGTLTVRVQKPSRLCAPVAKNGVAVKHRVQHLVCYPVTPKPKVVRRVSVRNQFGREVFRTGQVGVLCVPTLKLPLPNAR